jgi:hypothetical protein
MIPERRLEAVCKSSFEIEVSEELIFFTLCDRPTRG